MTSPETKTPTPRVDTLKRRQADEAVWLIDAGGDPYNRARSVHLLSEWMELACALERENNELRAVAEAAVAYDDAIRLCANDPERMASFCSATGDDLDALYLRWMELARAALAAHSKGAIK